MIAPPEPPSYCLALGHHAEAIGRGCVAIGDGVSVIEDDAGRVRVSPAGTLRIGDRLAIGPTVLGEPCNLEQIVERWLRDDFGVPS